MKLVFLILLFLNLNSSGQSSENFSSQTMNHLQALKDSLTTTDYQYFLTLISKRDTASLMRRFRELDAINIVLIEGYHFKTGKYGIFEEYHFTPFGKSWESKAFLNNHPADKLYSSVYLDSSLLTSPAFRIDSLYPRVYQMGMGCGVTRQMQRVARRLQKKAKKDGVVLESYCRIETIFLKSENRIITRFLVPVAGKRKTLIRSGFGTDIAKAGLEFWLFRSSYFTGD
jgi:hypothetical protein